MCTVSFFPTGNSNFILTSNRDESPGRDTTKPRVYEKNAVQGLYPRDELAGGSWIGASSMKRVLCVLNGGFTFHERKPPYKKSRGLIMINLLYAHDITFELKNTNWVGIEPFTLIIIEWDTELSLLEFVWDGTETHFREMDIKPHIWSSSSLFSEEMKKERRRWFDEFTRDKNNFEPESIWRFHTEGGELNDDYGYIMDRGFVKTTSITQIRKTENEVEMIFKDRKRNTYHKKEMPLIGLAHE